MNLIRKALFYIKHKVIDLSTNILLRLRLTGSSDLRNMEGSLDLVQERDVSILKKSKSKNPFRRPKEKTVFLQSYQYSYRPDFVTEVNNVRLMGPNGVGIQKGGKILEDSITMPGQRRASVSIQRSLHDHPLLTLKTLLGPDLNPSVPLREVDCACSLFSSWSNYYHWILEHCSKLRGLSVYEAKTGRKPMLIIPQDPPSLIWETLDMLKIEKARCMEWEPPAIDVETLVLPSYPEANPSNLHWLRKSFWGSVLTQNPKSPQRKIYISRNKAPKRKIVNEDEVLEVLTSHGFERVFAEDLSVKDQVQLFSEAEAIIGAHGAGMTNMIWGCEMTVFEIHNRFVRDHYYVLANNLGHDYAPIQGESTNPDRLNSDMKVNTRELESRLLPLSS